MDSWRKYIIDNEDNLSIEEVDDKVWEGVYKKGVPKSRSFVIKMKTVLIDFKKKFLIGKEGYHGTFGARKFKLAYAIVFVGFVMFSFGFKVKSYSKDGDMVSFSVIKNNYLLLNNEHSKNVFSSFSRINSPSDSSLYLYLKYIKKSNPEAKEMLSNLKVTEGVRDLVITPVMIEFKESLFSSLLSKAFEIKLTDPKPNDKQIENKIKDVLKERGLGLVDIQIDSNKQDILFSSKPIHHQLVQQEQSFLINNDTIAINDITERIKAVDKIADTNQIVVANKIDTAAKPNLRREQEGEKDPEPKWDPEKWRREVKLMNLLIDGLVKEGLIDRNKPYTVQIKDGELYINNQKQPKELSDKMRPYFSGNNYGFMND